MSDEPAVHLKKAIIAYERPYHDENRLEYETDGIAAVNITPRYDPLDRNECKK